MAQNDKQHTGDSQNSQWWGAKQGLFINALANQLGQFESDITYRNTINQNEKFTIDVNCNRACVFSNILVDGVFNYTGMLAYLGNYYSPIPTIHANELWWSLGFGPSRKLNLSRMSVTSPNKKKTFTHSYDSSIIFSQSPPNLTGMKPYTCRVPLPNDLVSINGSILNTDNYYLSRQTIRINYGLSEVDTNKFFTGVIRDLRIYTRVLNSKEVTDNYHAMNAVNRTNLFCEWKMSQTSDFYTFGGNLYAKNTGSSGNGLNNGTGYDMQLVGYAGNIPILQTIY